MKTTKKVVQLIPGRSPVRGPMKAYCGSDPMVTRMKSLVMRGSSKLRRVSLDVGQSKKKQETS